MPWGETMIFADIGWPELLVILSLALMIFGPQRMVELARTAGKALREFRKITDEFSGTFTDILKEEPPPRTHLPAAAKTAAQTQAEPPQPPTFDDSLPIPPLVTVPPDEYDPADQSMPPFPAESEPADEPAPETDELLAPAESIGPSTQPKSDLSEETEVDPDDRVGDPARPTAPED